MSSYASIDERGWYDLTQSLGGPVQRDMRSRAERLQRLARRQVGKRTGELARSIQVTNRMDLNGREWWVGSNNRNALRHHKGTRPYLIFPESGRVLRFSLRGRMIYTRVVRHPGTRPNRYLTDNLRRVVN